MQKNEKSSRAKAAFLYMKVLSDSLDYYPRTSERQGQTTRRERDPNRDTNPQTLPFAKGGLWQINVSDVFIGLLSKEVSFSTTPRKNLKETPRRAVPVSLAKKCSYCRKSPHVRYFSSLIRSIRARCHVSADNGDSSRRTKAYFDCQC